MPYFEDVDALQIAENHIREIQKLEEQKAKDLLAVYRRVRRDLRDRLDVMGEDAQAKFTAQRMRGVLLQVEMAIAAMGDSLKREIEPQAMELARKGSEHLIKEIEKFSQEFEGAILPIDLDTVSIALDTKNFLINQYQVSIDSYSEQVRSVITQQITRSAIEEVGLAEMIRRISRFFIGEEWKLLRIARTELHNVYNLGKLNSMKDTRDKYVPDLKKALIHPMDSRTASDSKQLASLDPVVPVDKPFKYTYTRRLKDGTVKKEQREFMVPPERPNDRAILIPYRREWDKERAKVVNG